MLIIAYARLRSSRFSELRRAPLFFKNTKAGHKGPPKLFRVKREKAEAGTTRLELATSCVTGMRSNQLSYAPI